MPRQDVPYGGAICRLRERIAEIFDKLGEKLHTINGVPGDGDGNVKIVSGSSAVVISNDPTQNEIAVSLDTSQLPAASVASVNGQTGAVAITADDVPSDNGDVQTDLDNLAAADATLQGNINAEALARQGADATLQSNINNITASLPSQVVAAVAADPTIALLVSADSDNVKLTGNQSIGGIKTVSTEATGTYSQQIANSQKVKNELDNYPLVVRTTGSQMINGNKSFNTFIDMTAGTTELRIYDNTSKTNQIAGFGVRYRTGTSTNASIKSYAPKANPSDPAEVQRGGFLQLVSNQNGTMELVIFATNASGTLIRKSLAYFDGSVWN